MSSDRAPGPDRPEPTATPADRDLLARSRALGDPTRHAVFAYLRDAPGPVGVAELTDHLGLHHNAIRQHLAKLRDAGLVVEEREPPSGPGRPRMAYRPVPGAAERWGGPSPHELLSLALLDLLGHDGTAREAGRRAGRRLSAALAADVGTVEALEGAARRLDFEPRVEPTADGVDVVLRRCPFAEAATAAPAVVCALHHGIAEGVAEGAADTATVAGLVVRPPARAGCRIQVVVPA